MSLLTAIAPESPAFVYGDGATRLIIQPIRNDSADADRAQLIAQLLDQYFAKIAAWPVSFGSVTDKTAEGSHWVAMVPSAMDAVPLGLAPSGRLAIDGSMAGDMGVSAGDMGASAISLDAPIENAGAPQPVVLMPPTELTWQLQGGYDAA